MEISRNELVYLETRNNEFFEIHRVSDDLKVGLINLFDDQLYFSIEPEYRNQHYCSNGVYLLTKYLHETLQIDEFAAFVPTEDTQSQHICEHAGFYAVERTPGMTVYVHDGGIAHKEEKCDDAIYFAGGCFWGVERGFKMLDCIRTTDCGYVNGDGDGEVSYENVMHGDTGFKECVKVTFDKNDIYKVLEAYFIMIDPEQADGQGNDIGTQYQTGIYYANDEIGFMVANFVRNIRVDYPNFCVEVGPLVNFYRAEEYHQDYLGKYPEGYCHISVFDYERVKALNNK